MKLQLEQDAVISPCGQYRYVLTREVGPGERRATFIMLNPSTADATQDDPTEARKHASYMPHHLSESLGACGRCRPRGRRQGAEAGAGAEEDVGQGAGGAERAEAAQADRSATARGRAGARRNGRSSTAWDASLRRGVRLSISLDLFGRY
jgi:hypothetical protein